jgi:hypothetical protein
VEGNVSEIAAKVYHPRDHEASPFFTLVHDYFDDFEHVYPERFEKRYGFWRPVIRSSINKFLKCGDLNEGFARVRCLRLWKRIFCGIFLPPALLLSVVRSETGTPVGSPDY